MIKTCQYCGTVNSAPVERCAVCDARLSPKRAPGPPEAAPHRTEGNLAVAPEWRREVAERLQAYRARRGVTPSDYQCALSFEAAAEAEDAAAEPEAVAPPPDFRPPMPAQRSLFRPAGSDRVDISIHGNGGVAGTPGGNYPGVAQGGAHAGAGQSLPCPPALVAERFRAALLDAAFLAFSYGAMLALFWTLGGRIGFNKLDVAVTAATFALFYAQYVALFTVFGGVTPGMMLRGLRVVSFDGGLPTSRQMMWRSFGYLVAAGTCFLGFLWALWDDDHLCWQDRISQTYLISSE